MNRKSAFLVAAALLSFVPVYGCAQDESDGGLDGLVETDEALAVPGEHVFAQCTASPGAGWAHDAVTLKAIVEQGRVVYVVGAEFSLRYEGHEASVLGAVNVFGTGDVTVKDVSWSIEKLSIDAARRSVSLHYRVGLGAKRSLYARGCKFSKLELFRD